METREIKITRETAERWYNGCDKELKELALQTYPELKEPEYKIGERYAFADMEHHFDIGSFDVGELHNVDLYHSQKWKMKCGDWYKYIRKIEYKFLD